MPDKRRAWNSTLPAATKPMKKTRLKRKGRYNGKQSSAAYGSYHKWIGTRGCLVAGKAGHVCSGQVRGHHIKHVRNGGVDYKNEVPLCDGAHTVGPHAVHGLNSGKWSFERHYGVSLYREAKRYAGLYLAELAQNARAL